MLNEKYPFLAEMLNTVSPTGNEERIQKLWKEEATKFADDVMTDNFGNVYAAINPNADFKVMLAGHADEIAFMVKHIDSNGYIYMAKAGGINPAIAIGNKVNIYTETEIVRGIVGNVPEHINDSKTYPKLESVYIDIGAKDKEEASKLVSIGDYIVYDSQYVNLLNNNISSKALDNKTGSFIVLEAVRRLKELNPKVGVYAVSTVNEETNQGGATMAANFVEPTVAVICDVTFATDQPSSNPKKEGEVDLGGGPVLSHGAPIHRILNQQLKEVASKEDIKIQYELTPGRTGTDLDTIRYQNGGIPSALVSLPLRYMHSPSEVVNLDDIEAEIELLVKWIMSLDGTESYKLV